MFDAFTRAMGDFNPLDIGEGYFCPLPEAFIKLESQPITDPLLLDPVRGELVRNASEQFGPIFTDMDLLRLPKDRTAFGAVVSALLEQSGTTAEPTLIKI